MLRFNPYPSKRQIASLSLPLSTTAHRLSPPNHRGRNPPTRRLYIYRRNKFLVRFRGDGRCENWRQRARSRVCASSSSLPTDCTLLLYRGPVNKLNQIRSAMPRVAPVFSTSRSPGPFLPRPRSHSSFLMARDGGGKIATIESEE